MARQNFRFKSVWCKAVCLFLLFNVFFLLGGVFSQAWAAGPFAYILNESNNTVRVIDTSDNSVAGSVAVGKHPIGVAVNPVGTRVYVSNYESNNVSVIDTANNSVVATVAVGNNPIGVAVNPAGTRVYVTNCSTSDSVSVIDTSNNSVVATISVGNDPHGVAVNPAGTRVYVSNTESNNISVIDTSNNSVVATVAVGTRPVGVAVNPAGTRVYVANEGVYVTSTIVSVIDTSNNTVVSTVTVGNNPCGLAFNPSGTRLYAVNVNSSSVSVIDPSNNSVVATVAVGGLPHGVAVNPAGTRVYVVNWNGSVSVIDTSNNTVVTTIAAGGTSYSLGQFIAQASVSGVTRILPSCYAAGTNLTVTINATPASTTGTYAIEETPPAGWTVSNISDGVLYSGIIKFGPFFDNTARTLTYDVTPPATATGDNTFAGTASQDGVSTAVAGQTVISACPLYHPADTNKDFVISMDELTAYGAAWKKGTAWSIEPNPIPLDYVIRAATLWKKGGKYKIDFTAGTYPACWLTVSKRSARTDRDGESSAVRHLPEVYKAGEAFEVSVSVTPASGVDAYGIEDQIPLGWTASGMNEGGSFDAAAFKVKFGPFITDQAKTLTYQVTPLADAKGAYTFAGTASFDGTDSPQITGDISVTDILPGDLNSDLKADLKDAVTALQIAAATQPPPNAALAADVNRDGKIGTEEAVFALEKAAE